MDISDGLSRIDVSDFRSDDAKSQLSEREEFRLGDLRRYLRSGTDIPGVEAG